MSLRFYRRCGRGSSKKVSWEVQEGCLKISEGDLEERKNEGRLEICVVRVEATKNKIRGRRRICLKRRGAGEGGERTHGHSCSCQRGVVRLRRIG